MHFVGEHAGKKLVRKETPVFSQATGEKTTTLPTIWVNLERGTAPEWAAELAQQRFSFSMRPTPGSIGGQDISVQRWAVYIDTEAWAKQHGYDDAIRLQAEAVLGGAPDLMRVEPPRLRAPWPNYDELTVAGRRSAQHVAERNLETAATIGATIGDLIAYERGTANREEIIALYEQALAAAQPQDQPESVLIEA